MAVTSEIHPAHGNYEYSRLVAEIRAGDTCAMDEFYRRFEQGMRWLIIGSLGTEDAEDVLK